jgi:hypothetical protein
VPESRLQIAGAQCGGDRKGGRFRRTQPARRRVPARCTSCCRRPCSPCWLSVPQPERDAGSQFLVLGASLRNWFAIWRERLGGLSLAKITSAFIFMVFQQAPIRRPNELLNVKTAGLLFIFLAGWNFGEGKLSCAGFQGPLIFVAHSYGGLMVRAYANEWTGQVAGLVLVETPDESSIFNVRSRTSMRRLRS